MEEMLFYIKFINLMNVDLISLIFFDLFLKHMLLSKSGCWIISSFGPRGQMISN